MATDNNTTTTPQTVIDHATTRADIPRTALIGTFGGPTSLAALIRSPNGKITRVTVGDPAAGGIVAAIGDGQIVVAQRGKTRILKLPET